MTRGLRILPWLQEAKRRGQSVEHLFDCSKCKREQSRSVRQYMGCGYESIDPRVPVMPWDGQSLGRVPQPDEVDDKGKYLHPVCAGYVCGLPEVIEASHAYLFLKNGGLFQFTEGMPPTPALRDAVTILECENGRVMEWTSKNPQETK